MNNQLLINSVAELGFSKTALAIRELFRLQLLTFKQAYQLLIDLQQLKEA